MKSRKLSIHVVVVFIALVLVGSSANAQKGRYDRSREGRGGAYGKSYVNHNWNGQLELTDEQKAKIEEIKLASGKESLQRQNKVNELEAQLTTALSQDKVDKNKVNNLIDEIGKLRTDSRKARVADHLKIRELLTEKQKIIFDQHRSGRYFSGDHPRNRMGR